MGKAYSKLSFAHLVGIGKRARAEEEEKPAERDHEDGQAKKAEDEKEQEWAKKAEDDPEREQGEDESDEDYKARMKKMDEDEDEVQAEEDEDDEKAEDEDDDKDTEMRGSSPVAKARRREQRRCAAIFSSKMAARNPVLAANLAFKTRMTRKEAIAVLEGTPAPAGLNINRASKNPNIGNGRSSDMSSKEAVNKSLDHAFARATGKVR